MEFDTFVWMHRKLTEAEDLVADASIEGRTRSADAADEELFEKLGAVLRALNEAKFAIRSAAIEMKSKEAA